MRPIYRNLGVVERKPDAVGRRWHPDGCLEGQSLLFLQFLRYALTDWVVCAQAIGLAKVPRQCLGIEKGRASISGQRLVYGVVNDNTIQAWSNFSLIGMKKMAKVGSIDRRFQTNAYPISIGMFHLGPLLVVYESIVDGGTGAKYTFFWMRLKSDMHKLQNGERLAVCLNTRLPRWQSSCLTASDAPGARV